MRIFGILITFIILIVVGALLAPQFIDWNKYKGQIISQVESNTGFDIKIDGDLDLAVLPMPRVVVNKVSLTNPKEENTLVTLDHADVYLDVMPLLSGKVSLKSITLNKPVISLRVARDGTQNWMTDALKPSEESGEGEADSKSSSDIAIGSLTIKEGALSYDDQKAGSLQEIKNINGTFSMASLQGPFDVSSSFDAFGQSLNINAKTETLDIENKTISATVKAGSNGAELNFSGVIGYGETPDAQGETSITIANLKSFLENVTGSEQSASLDMAIKTSGILTASAESANYTNLNASIGDKTLKGSAKVENISDYPKSSMKVTTDLTGADNLLLKMVANISGASLKISNADLGYKSSKLKGDIAYIFPKKNGKAKVDASVTSSSINADELMTLMGAKSSSSKSSGGLKQTAQSFNLPVDAKVNISADKVIYQGSALNNLKLNADLSGNKLTLKNASIKNYAGADASVKGAIANISALSGLDLNIAFETDDIEATMAVLGQANILKSAPTKIGAVKVNADVGGSIDALGFDANVDALNGTIKAKGTATSIETSPSFKDMTFGLKHPDLAALLQKVMPGSEKNAALAKSVDMTTKIDLQENIYALKELKGSFGPITLNGNITANMTGSIPSITGDISTGKLPLETFMGDAKTSGSAGGSGAGSDRWSKDPIDTTWMKSANVDLTVSSSAITYGKWNFEKPSFGLTMKSGTLSIDKWDAGLFGGTSAVNLKMTGGQGLNVNTDMALDNVGLQSLVIALAGAPVIQSKGVVDFNTKISSSGSSMANLISSLAGNGDVNGTDITIRGIDVAEMTRALTSTSSLGGQARALFGSGIRGGSSKFETLNGVFTVNDGIVTFSKLDLTGNEAVVATTGTVSLPAWMMDMKSSVQLIVPTEEEPPPPFEISYRGSLSNPGSSFAQNALEGYLNKKISAKANKLIQDKLGDKLDGKLGGVVGGLLGLPPQEQKKAPVEEPQPANENAAPEVNQNSPYVPDSAKVQQQEQAQPQEEEKPKKVEPEDIVKDVLKGFLR